MHGICILDRLLLGRGKRLKRLATELLLSEGIPDLIVGLDEFVLDIDVLLVAGLDLILDLDSITRGDDGTLTQPFDLTTLKLREEGLVLGVRNELDSVVLQLIQLDGDELVDARRILTRDHDLVSAVDQESHDVAVIDLDLLLLLLLWSHRRQTPLQTLISIH